MNKFIEIENITDKKDIKKTTVNVDYIFKIEPAEYGCLICLIPYGYNNYAHQLIKTSQGYDEIISLISN